VHVNNEIPGRKNQLTGIFEPALEKLKNAVEIQTLTTKE
jgi:hypothetical protein